MVLTNKHVVLDEKADYTVFTNDGQKFPAKVIAKDPLQDLAIIKIESNEKFTPIKLGDSDNLEIGQTVIAIGNALGEFRNTVSVGVISGLGRTVTASGGGFIETIEDVIQTDAAINKGNSGGPLLNLKGEVIGINTAMALGAQNIGFAIPINKAKKDIEQVKTLGKIVYPFLGVRYLLINERVQKEYNLGVNYGALVKEVIPQSPAFKAALKEKDIILEFNGEKITPENSLKKIIEKYNPGDKVFLKILRKGQKKIFEVILGEWEE
jgi:serine protease Do